MTEISVVVPVRNEDESIKPFLQRTENVLDKIGKPYEIINELKKKFTIINETYFPIPISIKFCNLCIALDLKLKA